MAPAFCQPQQKPLDGCLLEAPHQAWFWPEPLPSPLTVLWAGAAPWAALVPGQGQQGPALTMDSPHSFWPPACRELLVLQASDPGLCFMFKPSKDYNPFCFPYLDTTWSFYKNAFFFLIASFIPFVHDSSLLWIFSVFFGRLYAFLLSLQKVSLISLCATCKNVTFAANSFFFLVTSLLIFIQWPPLKWW